jgi:hypothetical protein
MTALTGTAVTVEVARSRARIRRFVEFPYRLYRDDPDFVPPLRPDCRRLLSRRRNPFFEYGEAELFLARRDGRVAGRIAAVHNPRHNALYGVRDGFFGQFECVDDPAVAVALFRAAERWLRERGLTSIAGPVNFTTSDECGLLVDGFDAPPRVLMPYNPPYYPALLEHCGLRKAKDLWSWECGVEVDPRVLRIAGRAGERYGITMRSLDLRRFDADLARIRYVCDASMGNNWGYVPITDAELAAQGRALRKIVDPALVQFAEIGGEPVGLGLALPDLNQALPAARGRLTRFGLPVGLVRLALAARRVDRVRGVLLGVLPEYQGRGIEALIYARGLTAMRTRGYRGPVELGWTLEDNDPVNRAHAAIGARRTKTYRIYRRDLGSADAGEAPPVATVQSERSC